MDKIVIIGGGIAGLSAAENIRKNSDAEIMIISNEKYLPYNRLKLSKYLCSEFNIEDIYMHKQEWFDEKNIQVILNTYIKGIDVKNNYIVSEDDKKIDYTKLILANGSRCFIPPFDGVQRKGVFSIREAQDVQNIKDYVLKNGVKDIAVIGGGLLGIEAAWSFKSSMSDLNISIIETADRILPRQMDKEGSAILENIIYKNDVKLYKSTNVKEIVGTDRVEGILLVDGNLVKADMIIISAGVRSNLEIIKESGVETNRGVIVDSFMKTNIDNVFSAGDIAEFNNNVYGIWPVAMEQGKIAGLNSVGVNTQYNEITPSNLLQVMDINIFSTGNTSDGSLSEFKIDSGIYTKIFYKDGIIYGGILIGDTKKGFALKRAIDQKKDFKKEIEQGINILQLI